MVESAGATAANLLTPLPVRVAAALRPIRLPDWLATALAYFTIAIVTRAVLLGNPQIHVDEQFYLLVGDRMVQGALPYVDIWDRKPIGLFLLFAAFRLVPGDGVLTYQAMSLAALVGTSMVIARLAREIAPRAAAWQAGVAYMLFLPIFNCAMGQAPVFYNLLVALAALALVETVKRIEQPGLLWRGAGIMLLVGVAIQIKYTVVFEGMVFGLLLLARGFADVWSYKRLGAAALLWVAAALAPTLAALGAYAAMGHAQEFIFANFLSIFERGSDGAVAYGRLAKEIAVLLPFWLAIFHAPRRLAPSTGESPRSLGIIKIWAMAACAGFLLFGTWYDHYVGPLLLPLSVLAAPALGRVIGRERRYAQFLIGLGILGTVVVTAYQLHRRGGAGDVEQATALIRGEMHGGCAYIYEGEPVLYRTTHSCLPTAWNFPNHLNTWIEAPALGIAPNTEVRRILANRPDVVVIGESAKPYLPNLETRAIVKGALAQDYVRYGGFKLGERPYGVYRLRVRPTMQVAAR